jgi:hypothetical protein
VVSAERFAGQLGCDVLEALNGDGGAEPLDKVGVGLGSRPGGDEARQLATAGDAPR